MSPQSRPLSPFNSSYSIDPLPQGGARIQVQPAVGPKAPVGLLWIPVVLAVMTYVGAGLEPAFIVGGVALFLAGMWVLGRSMAIDRFSSRRTRAGSFDVTPEGLSFPQGGFLPKDSIFRVVHRNAADGVVLSGFVVGNGFAGAAAVAGAHQQAKDFHAFEAISHQLEVESGGQAYPLVGCMTEATARAVMHDLAQILALR